MYDVEPHNQTKTALTRAHPQRGPSGGRPRIYNIIDAYIYRIQTCHTEPRHSIRTPPSWASSFGGSLFRGLPPRLPLSCLGDGTRAPVVVVPIPVRARETASSLRTRSEKDRFFRSARSERFAQTGLGTHPRKSGETGPGPIDSGRKWQDDRRQRSIDGKDDRRQNC